MKAAIFCKTTFNQGEQALQTELLERIAIRKGYEVEYSVEESWETHPGRSEGLATLLKYAAEGSYQLLMINQLTQMGRKPLEIMKWIDLFHSQHVSIYIHDLGYQTLEESGQLHPDFYPVYNLLQGFVLQEKDIKSLRVRRGQQLAKSDGKHIGRPIGSTETRKQVLEKYPEVVAAIKKGLSLRQASSKCGVSVNTVRKVKKALLPPKPLKQLTFFFENESV
ncbi:MAG: recombinase family protein [Bacteroidota bacterium]